MLTRCFHNFWKKGFSHMQAICRTFYFYMFLLRFRRMAVSEGNFYIFVYISLEIFLV